MLSLQIWKEAAGQMFFSLSISLGRLIMFSSYNKFDNNIMRDALIISTCDFITSLLASVVIFSNLGHLKHKMELPDIKEVVKSGKSFTCFFFAFFEKKKNVIWQLAFSVAKIRGIH